MSRQAWSEAEVRFGLERVTAGDRYAQIAQAMTSRFGRPFTMPAVRMKLGPMRPPGTPLPSRMPLTPVQRGIVQDEPGFDVDLSDLAPAPPAAAVFDPEEPPTDPYRSPSPPAPPAESETARDLRERRMREQVRELELAKKRLLDELRDRDAQIDALTALRHAPPTPIVAPRGRGEHGRRVGTPVLLCSDWHVEEPVEPEAVGGLNEYNLDIADACIDRCADAFEWLSRDARYDCRQAIVWLGGDLYSGFIHDELMEHNFLSPVQAVEWLQGRIEAMLRKILDTTNFETIRVVCNDGNHGRLTHKTRVATRTANSLEWLLYKTLAARTASEPRLHWQIADGEWSFVDVFDQTIGFTHGDSFRYQGGVGGLLIPLRRGFNEIKKYRKCDIMACGHFHQRTDTGEIVVNGSMIGINPYSMHLHATPERRQQSWFMVDSTRGKCLSAPVWL